MKRILWALAALAFCLGWTPTASASSVCSVAFPACCDATGPPSPVVRCAYDICLLGLFWAEADFTVGRGQILGEPGRGGLFC